MDMTNLITTSTSSPTENITMPSYTNSATTTTDASESLFTGIYIKMLSNDSLTSDSCCITANSNSPLLLPEVLSESMNSEATQNIITDTGILTGEENINETLSSSVANESVISVENDNLIDNTDTATEEASSDKGLLAINNVAMALNMPININTVDNTTTQTSEATANIASLSNSGAAREASAFIKYEMSQGNDSKTSDNQTTAADSTSDLSLSESELAKQLDFKLPVNEQLAKNKIHFSQQIGEKLFTEINNSNNSIWQNNQLNNLLQTQAASAQQRYSDAVNIPIHNASWGHQFSDKIVWLNQHNINQAEIHIDPPDLGSIDVNIKMENGRTEISFVTANYQVKEALEASLTTLRESFSANNLNLVNVSVSHQQTNSNSQSSHQKNETSATNPLENNVDSNIKQTYVAKGLVDYFA